MCEKLQNQGPAAANDFYWGITDFENFTKGSSHRLLSDGVRLLIRCLPEFADGSFDLEHHDDCTALVRHTDVRCKL